ncbi:MAG: hypothetical protein IPK97_15315 [Ahniella sp.]|nr:hypothetical protein [Ahniella sp.]
MTKYLFAALLLGMIVLSAQAQAATTTETTSEAEPPVEPTPGTTPTPEPPTCDLRASNGQPYCEPAKVVTYTKSCPRSSGSPQHACPDVALPPPAEISCTSSNYVVVCDAWPASSNLTYRYVWSILNGVDADYSADQFTSTLVGNCTGRAGRVSVTVIAPNGLSTTAQAFFACEGNQ